jgi:uncharacterized protein YecE (DUF72 family)
VAVTNPDLAIVRFHGRNAETWYLKGAESSRERFKYLYTTEELCEWVPKITEMANQVHEVHVLMNNNYVAQDVGPYAIKNAQEMQQLLGEG